MSPLLMRMRDAISKKHEKTRQLGARDLGVATTKQKIPIWLFPLPVRPQKVIYPINLSKWTSDSPG